MSTGGKQEKVGEPSEITAADTQSGTEQGREKAEAGNALALRPQSAANDKAISG